VPAGDSRRDAGGQEGAGRHCRRLPGIDHIMARGAAGLEGTRAASWPLLAVGDGAMGFWAALEEVFPATRTQRCWFHKLGNVLNALPTSQQARAKAAMQDIFMAATSADALAAFENSLRPMARSIRRPWRSLRKTGTVYWRSMTSRPSTGSMYEPPIRLSRHLPRCDTGPRGPGTACRGLRSGAGVQVDGRSRKVMAQDSWRRQNQAVTGWRAVQGWPTGAGQSAGTTETRRLMTLCFRPAVHQI
jgi:hypothetical protein